MRYIVGGLELGIQLARRYKLVWKKTTETYRDMVEVEGWKGKEVVDIPVIQKITLKVGIVCIV